MKKLLVFLLSTIVFISLFTACSSTDNSAGTGSSGLDVEQSSTTQSELEEQPKFSQEPIDPDDASGDKKAIACFDGSGFDFEPYIADLQVSQTDLSTMAGALGLQIFDRSGTLSAGDYVMDGYSLARAEGKSVMLFCSVFNRAKDFPSKYICDIQQKETLHSALEKMGFGPEEIKYLESKIELTIEPSSSGWKAETISENGMYQPGNYYRIAVYSNTGNGLYYQFEFFGTSGNAADTVLDNVTIVNVNGEA